MPEGLGLSESALVSREPDSDRVRARAESRDLLEARARIRRSGPERAQVNHVIMV